MYITNAYPLTNFLTLLSLLSAQDERGRGSGGGTPRPRWDPRRPIHPRNPRGRNHTCPAEEAPQKRPEDLGGAAETSDLLYDLEEPPAEALHRHR